MQLKTKGQKHGLNIRVPSRGRNMQVRGRRSLKAQLGARPSHKSKHRTKYIRRGSKPNIN